MEATVRAILATRATSNLLAIHAVLDNSQNASDGEIDLLVMMELRKRCSNDLDKLATALKKSGT